jgi:hypothetical protein
MSSRPVDDPPSAKRTGISTPGAAVAKRDGPSRSAVDLLELPWVFSQLKPLTVTEFLKHARLRMVELTEHDLEALHRQRILVPLLRASRDGRKLRAEIRANRGVTFRQWRWDPTWSLGHERLTGRTSDIAWHDPSLERYRRWSGRTIVSNNRSAALDQYLYSPYQVIALPFLKASFRYFEHADTDRGRVAEIKAPRPLLARWQATGKRLRGAIIAATALEARHRPDIVCSFNTNGRDDAEYIDWQQQSDSGITMEWLGVDRTWLSNTAGWLLRAADSFDPLGDWLDVVRVATPSRWERLRGDALVALDMRIVSELLLACHDDVQAQDDEASRSRSAARDPRPLGGRLTRKRGVDDVLTEYGLSPHPRLVVVLEGATEMYMWPRLLDYFGISRDEDFITAIDRGGVDRNIEPLLAYAAPRVIPTRPAGSLELTRPPTRFLIVTDPEGKMGTPELREKRRKTWVNRLLESLPPEYRDESLRPQLDRLVFVETWNAKGEAFEFANFTTREIAMAIRQTSSPLASKPLAQVQTSVGNLRRRRDGLKSLGVAAPHKGELAPQLWSILNRKLDRAASRGTQLNVPVARIVVRAFDLAAEWPRGNSTQLLGPIPRSRDAQTQNQGHE